MDLPRERGLRLETICIDWSDALAKPYKKFFPSVKKYF